MFKKLIFKFKYLLSKRFDNKLNYQFNERNFESTLKNRNQSYNYFHHYFWNLALEIGVYRGQTISLWRLISEKINKPVDIVAISPFTSAGDEVSTYASNIDYYEDTLNNFQYFNLKLPIFIKGYSTDTGVLNQVKKSTFDLIYIDGNHDYDIVKADFLNFSQLLNENGLIIFDDSSLNTDYSPPIYASKGHLGPSKLTQEIDTELFVEILSVGHNRVFQKIKVEL